MKIIRGFSPVTYIYWSDAFIFVGEPFTSATFRNSRPCLDSVQGNERTCERNMDKMFLHSIYINSYLQTISMQTNEDSAIDDPQQNKSSNLYLQNNTYTTFYTYSPCRGDIKQW